jgi:hypothetical protein
VLKTARVVLRSERRNILARRVLRLLCGHMAKEYRADAVEEFTRKDARIVGFAGFGKLIRSTFTVFFISFDPFLQR